MTQLVLHRYHNLLLTALHVVAAPQRSQLYRSLQFGKSLVSFPPLTDSFTVSGATALAADSQQWRIIFQPATKKRSDAVATPCKTNASVEYSLPKPVCRWISNYQARWRPLLIANDHDYVFVNSDGGGPVSLIRPFVVSVCRELTGQSTPPHLFRSIIATHVFNNSEGRHDLLESLARSMATSVETLRKHYILPDRLKDSAATQAAIDTLLKDAKDIAVVEAKSPLQTAKLNFSRRLRKHATPARPVINNKRQRLSWSAQEEAALLRGVELFGAGAWARILKDEQLGAVLVSRTNVDCKDKWRSMSSQKKKLQV